MRTRSKFAWSDADDAQLRECAERKWSVPRIALRLRRSNSAVQRRARLLGVKVQSPVRLPSAERRLPG